MYVSKYLYIHLKGLYIHVNMCTCKYMQIHVTYKCRKCIHMYTQPKYRHIHTHILHIYIYRHTGLYIYIHMCIQILVYTPQMYRRTLCCSLHGSDHTYLITHIRLHLSDYTYTDISSRTLCCSLHGSDHTYLITHIRLHLSNYTYTYTCSRIWSHISDHTYLITFSWLYISIRLWDGYD